jgi:nucleotide-binding universal stress UspA family protein
MDDGGGLMRVLVALDGSPIGESAVAAIANWVATTKAELHLLTVIHPDRIHETLAPHAGHEFTPEGTSSGQLLHTHEPPARTAEDRSQALERARVNAEQYLRQVAERYVGDYPAHVDAAFDDETAPVIIQKAVERDVDFIAMGTRGRGGIGRAMLGSVAERVVRGSAIPVMLIGPRMRSELTASSQAAATSDPPQESPPAGAQAADTAQRRSAADASIEGLIDWLGSSDWQLRRQARLELGARGSEAVEPLLGALNSGNDDVRWGAVKVLDEMSDEQAIPSLIDLLEDRNSSVRWAAGEALISIGRPSVIPVLQRLLVNPGSVWLHEGAHHVLQRMVEPETTPVVDALEGPYPSITVPPRVHDALKKLEGFA